MTMRAARMHGYKQPLQIDEVPVPEPGPGEVLVKVAATGMCRSDYQLLDGYFPVELAFPYIPGHEVAGHIAQVGPGVPASAGPAEGDMVVVDPAWGEGTCRQCHEGNEQLCTGSGGWIGFGPPGGFAEYVVVPWRLRGAVRAAARRWCDGGGLRPQRRQTRGGAGERRRSHDQHPRQDR